MNLNMTLNHFQNEFHKVELVKRQFDQFCQQRHQQPNGSPMIMTDNEWQDPNLRNNLLDQLNKLLEVFRLQWIDYDQHRSRRTEYARFERKNPASMNDIEPLKSVCDLNSCLINFNLTAAKYAEISFLSSLIKPKQIIPSCSFNGAKKNDKNVMIEKQCIFANDLLMHLDEIINYVLKGDAECGSSSMTPDSIRNGNILSNIDDVMTGGTSVSAGAAVPNNENGAAKDQGNGTRILHSIGVLLVYLLDFEATLCEYAEIPYTSPTKEIWLKINCNKEEGVFLRYQK